MKLSKLAFALGALMSAATIYADTLNVAIDISGSTPVVQPVFMRTALPIIADQIEALPVGSRIKAFSVGDDTAPALNIDLWVQRSRTAQGDTAKELAGKVTRMIANYLNELRAKPETMQGESSLSPAFLDASKWCQKGKPCKMIYLTDGLEYQPGIIAWPREYTKPLPPIPGLDLDGMEVLMYGIGQGAPTKARIAIEQHWLVWLKAHNAGKLDLRRL